MNSLNNFTRLYIWTWEENHYDNHDTITYICPFFSFNSSNYSYWSFGILVITYLKRYKKINPLIINITHQAVSKRHTGALKPSSPSSHMQFTCGMKQLSITTPPEWDARLLHSPFSPPPPPFQHDPLTIQRLPFKLIGGESHCVKKFFQKAFKGYKIFACDLCLKRQKWVQHWIIYPNFTFSWKPIHINMHYLSG